MFEKNSKLLFLIALIIGGIGAFGQAYMLYHELAECYPYKIVDYYFYKNIAITGLYSAPLLAVFIGFLLGWKRFWLTTIAPVVLCPLFFAFIFKSFSFFHDKTWSFDGKSSETIVYDFVLYTISLSITGLVIAMFCNFLLSFLSKRNKLA